ncbi:MAG: SpoIIIAH-like family protein [Ruminococcaceae bacterium]|nr:SpoIIIAH-like family protein [Oscillospiraceae bacterium]
MKNESTALTEIQQPNKFQMILEKIGKRNIIIACAVLLIGVAVLMNFILFSGANKDEGYDGYDQPSGNISDNAGDSTATDVNAYFSATQVSRQRARDEALEVLQAVVENVDSTEAMKNEALAEIAVIADEIQKEANIESLITAKGFEACVAVLNNDAASIVVKADDLQAAQIAQINAIVYEQAGILPSSVTIIKK